MAIKYTATSVDSIPVDETGNGKSMPTYKSYVAIINPAGISYGTDDPPVTVLNSQDANFVGDIVWTRQGPGYYTGILANAFTKNTQVFFQPNNNCFFSGSRGGDADLESTIELTIFDADYAGLDDKINRAPLRIDVYPNTPAA